MKQPSRILLISNSTVHGRGYLDHVEEEIKAFLGRAKTVLFFPFALFDCDDYAAKAKARFAATGYSLESAHTAGNPEKAIDRADAIFIGGGNTFGLLKALQDLELIEPIRRKVKSGMPYIGSSAGSNVAGPTIKTTKDMPNRPAALVRFLRPGSISNQSSLSRSRSEFHAHGRDSGGTYSPIPRRKRNASRRDSRRSLVMDRERRGDVERRNRRENFSPWPPSGRSQVRL
jgi:hypothetical protein